MFNADQKILEHEIFMKQLLELAGLEMDEEMSKANERYCSSLKDFEKSISNFNS